MSQKERQKWQAMLDADPKLRAAWDAFNGQLAKDAAIIGQGVQPTGQALGRAAREVHTAAGTDQSDDV